MNPTRPESNYYTIILFARIERTRKEMELIGGADLPASVRDLVSLDWQGEVLLWRDEEEMRDTLFQEKAYEFDPIKIRAVYYRQLYFMCSQLDLRAAVQDELSTDVLRDHGDLTLLLCDPVKMQTRLSLPPLTVHFVRLVLERYAEPMRFGVAVGLTSRLFMHENDNALRRCIRYGYNDIAEYLLDLFLETSRDEARLQTYSASFDMVADGLVFGNLAFLRLVSERGLAESRRSDNSAFWERVIDDMRHGIFEFRGRETKVQEIARCIDYAVDELGIAIPSVKSESRSFVVQLFDMVSSDILKIEFAPLLETFRRHMSVDPVGGGWLKLAIRTGNGVVLDYIVRHFLDCMQKPKVDRKVHSSDKVKFLYAVRRELDVMPNLIAFFRSFRKASYGTPVNRRLFASSVLSLIDLGMDLHGLQFFDPGYFANQAEVDAAMLLPLIPQWALLCLFSADLYPEICAAVVAKVLPDLGDSEEELARRVQQIKVDLRRPDWRRYLGEFQVNDLAAILTKHGAALLERQPASTLPRAPQKLKQQQKKALLA